VVGDDGAYWVERSGAAAERLGGDIVAAYEALEGDDVVFAPEVAAGLGEAETRELGGSLSIPERRADGSIRGYRMLLANCDDERLALLECAYEDFLETDQAWRADPSFYNSWVWLDTHPAFWTRSGHAGGLVGLVGPGGSEDPRSSKWPGRLWDWETSGHCGSLCVCPVLDEDTGAVAITVEAGGHVPDQERLTASGTVVVEGAYLEHYRDSRLEVSASSYEEAIMELAGKVDRFFAPDGEPRPDVPYEKTAWEVELERRIRDLDDDYPGHAEWRASLPRLPFEVFTRRPPDLSGE
jgi:hypothetical protein